jgi:hypothetical protein
MRYALPPDEAYVIWSLAWLGPFVGLFGILRGHWLLGAVHFLAGLFALAYWCDPDMTSWRRTFDITWVQVTMWTLLWEARNAEFKVPFYIFTALGALIYPFGWFTMDRPWVSGLIHAIVHVFAETGSLVLFSGNI